MFNNLRNLYADIINRHCKRQIEIKLGKAVKGVIIVYKIHILAQDKKGLNKKKLQDNKKKGNKINKKKREETYYNYGKVGYQVRECYRLKKEIYALQKDTKKPREF